jgi:hypothetical protein
MDKLARYTTIIKQILQEDARYKPSHGDIQPLLVFDDERHSYQLMYIGWDRRRRVHGSIYHLRLENNKVYIEEDTSNRPIAESLLEAGIPKEDIVLAFHAPDKRQYTDFAIA